MLKIFLIVLGFLSVILTARMVRRVWIRRRDAMGLLMERLERLRREGLTQEQKAFYDKLLAADEAKNSAWHEQVRARNRELMARMAPPEEECPEYPPDHKPGDDDPSDNLPN